jgi:ADP-ribose pyrophosphatase YjhB (NUDIX family)
MFCQNCGLPMQLTFLDGRNRFYCDPSQSPQSGCGYIHYQNPVPGVGLLIEYQGHLVLIQRGHPPHEGQWALPSGFIEVDETIEQAAVREAYEETGLQVELTELFSVHSFPEGPPCSGIILFYRARPLDMGALRAGDDAHDVKLFAPADLPPMSFRTHREALDRWRVVHASTQAPLRDAVE